MAKAKLSIALERKSWLVCGSDPPDIAFSFLSYRRRDARGREGLRQQPFAADSRNAALLWRELVTQGFSGRAGVVRGREEILGKKEPLAKAKVSPGILGCHLSFRITDHGAAMHDQNLPAVTIAQLC